LVYFISFQRENDEIRFGKGKRKRKEDKININCSKINMIEEERPQRRKKARRTKREDTIIKSERKEKNKVKFV
jgi:hypothetical protein